MLVARTVLSVAALCWGFVQAPFLHIHLEDHDHAPASLTHVHAHGLHRAAGPVIGAHTPDDDSIDIDWHIAAPQTFNFVPAPAPAGVTVVTPAAMASAVVPTPQPRGHDPPDLTLKQPRSPPA